METLAESNTDNASALNNQPIMHNENNRSCIRWRFITALMAFLAMFVLSTVKYNVIIAVVAMVNSTSEGTSETECGNFTDTTTPRIGEFDWDSETRGTILSSPTWGSIVSLFFIGFFIEKFGAKRVMTVGSFATIVFTMLGPVAARTNYGFFLTTRVICGMGQSVLYPCAFVLIANWYNTGERNKIVTIVCAGYNFGSAFTKSISGLLCQNGSDGGWPWAFYVFGIIVAVWLVFFCIFTYDSPRDNPWISQKEIQFIEKDFPEVKPRERPPVPWKAMLTSVALLSLVVNSFGDSWGMYTLSTNMPTYMSEVLGFDLQKNGLYSSLPDVLKPFYAFAIGFLADYLIANKILETKNVRRIFGVSAELMCGFCLLVITFLNCQTMTIYAMLVLAQVLLDGNAVGGYANAIDVSPNFVGIVKSYLNIVGSIPGIVAPYISGVLTNEEETKESWDIVFYIAIAVLFVFGILFGLLCDGEVQPWNSPNSEKKTDMEALAEQHDASFPQRKTSLTYGTVYN